MTKTSQPLIFTSISRAAALALLSACATTSHSTQTAELGVPSSLQALEAVVDQPGPIEVETVAAASWQVPLSGMLNLDDPSAQAAGLEDHDEPIQIFFHALRHPTRGLFIIDSGVEAAIAHDREHAAVRGLVASVAGLDTVQVRVDTRAWLERQSTPLRGVLLTHLHLDHVLGLPDVPASTPIYAGAGEAQATSFVNLFVQGTTDRELAGHAALMEWPFADSQAEQGIAGVLDVFGDGSLWALHVPGHTPGSTAYLARSLHGPVLFTGDACHTAWGWEHGVEPGTFSSDRPRSRASLLALIELVQRHPSIDVRLGHQSMAASEAPPAASARLERPTLVPAPPVSRGQ